MNRVSKFGCAYGKGDDGYDAFLCVEYESCIERGKAMRSDGLFPKAV